MNWTDTDATRILGIRYPIIQGPFGGGLSSIALLAAVCGCGGLGSFGAHHLSAPEILATAREARAATSSPFAINLWVSDHDDGGLALARARFDHALDVLRPFYRELNVDEPAYPLAPAPRFADQAAALLEAAPPVFSFVYGVPEPKILRECRRRGIVTIGTATTTEEAIAIEAAGVDVVVASGFEAGGHRASFLEPAESSLHGTLSLVPLVVDRVGCPVIAAGGIADGRGVAAAMMLGAKGVQIGTAFLACSESNAPDIHRARLLDPGPKRTTLTRAMTGRLARGLANTLTQALGPRIAELAPYPAQTALMRPIREAAIRQGRSDLLALWAGQSAPLVRERSASKLFASLVEEATENLRRFA